MIQPFLYSKLEGLRLLCKKHKVSHLYAFGSVCTDRFNERSDVDLIVEINEKDPVRKGEELLSLWDELEDFFKRKVDMLTDQPIKNPYLKANIDRTKILIYDGEGQKILV
ncbi:MAG: nucleotidyltransferase family protein [Bacteroidia bacterium]